MVHWRFIVFVLLCVCAGAPLALAVEPSDTKDNSADKTKAEKAAPKDRSKDPAVNAWYDRLLDSYMKADWEDFKDLYKQWATMRLKLSPTQRNNVIYMRGTAVEFRPGWWKNTQSTKNRSFKAQIWKRPITANYVPSETIGTQAAMMTNHGQLKVIVSWRPTYVDNPKPFTNDNSFHVFIPEAKDYGFTLGTMAEVIVWHELGHNYITINLPPKHVYKLFTEYGYLFNHVQEFYADMTALYHASPPGRLFTLKLRLMDMVEYDENSVHTRGCSHAVGALLLSKILAEPDKWPSFHFPGKVPEENIEQMTIFYVNRHVSPNWTLAEDKQLREFINKWIRTKGASVLKRKGLISLPNGQKMMIMAGEDRKYQKQRDQWIKQKLEAIIASGRADKPEVFENDMKDIENRVRWVPVKTLNTGDESSRSKSRRSSKKDPKKESRKTKPDKNLDDVLDDDK